MEHPTTTTFNGSSSPKDDPVRKRGGRPARGDPSPSSIAYSMGTRNIFVPERRGNAAKWGSVWYSLPLLGPTLLYLLLWRSDPHGYQTQQIYQGWGIGYNSGFSDDHDVDRQNIWSNHYPIHIQPRISFSREEQDAVGSANPPEVLHECLCLSNEPVKHLRYDWLHVPKTGTSFIISYWNLALQHLNVDYNFNSRYAYFFGNSYDLAIHDRYPLELYAKNSSLLFSHHTRHWPVDASLNHDYVTMLREPVERIVSAFHYGMMADGFNMTQAVELQKACYSDEVVCYASYPGIPHCVTKMMLGHRCADNVQLNESAKNLALQVLRKMPFVGLTEEWNEAVCQFHKAFGGKPPLGAFRNVNPRFSKKKVPTAEQSLRESFRDDYDQALYDVAKRNFYQRYLPDGKRCYRQTKDPAPSLRECWPRTCRELGKQCGEWPDGCGGVLVCGHCPLSRVTLPGNWRLECTKDGRCLHTCPLWVESGLWFSHDSASLVERLGAEGAPLEIARHEFYRNNLDHLTPSDAVWFCAEACDDPKRSSFARRFCSCGEKPREFMDISPSLSRFGALMDLDLKNIDRVYQDTYPSLLWHRHSHPMCCTSTEDQINVGSFGWKEGSPLAEFFATFAMGCGSYKACSELGGSHNAEVVVFCRATSLCHLGRNLRNPDIAIRGSNHEKASKLYLILHK